MGSISLAALTAKAVSFGSTQVQKISFGTTMIWQNIIPMGMTLTASVNIGASRNVWVRLTGWTARSGYPSTVVTSEGLIVGTSGRYLVFMNEVRSGAGANNDARVTVTRGGVTSVLATAGSGADTTLRQLSFEADLLLDDLISIEILHNSSISSSPRTSVGGETYLTIDKTA